MHKAAKICLLAALLATAQGCAKNPGPLPFLLESDDVIIESNDRQSAVEVAELLELSIEEPVLYDELDCVKGPSHIRVKKKGSLQESFDDLVDAGWDCVLILD